MAQTGFTPIQLYSTSTAAAAPSASNLTNSTLGSELAINITDGKLFYKDNTNAVQVIAWKTTPTTAGGTGLTSYTAGDLLYYATGSTLTKLAIGASGRFLSSTGSAPQWSAPAALTETDDTNVTLTLGGSPSTALLSAVSMTLGWTGQLAVTRGGTGLATVAQGDILYGSAANTLVALAKNTTATRYLSNTGASNNPAWAQIDLSNGVTGTLAVSRGGTGTGTAFTAGSVVFAGASGVYNQNNAQLFWDNTNTRLGIGTATPGEKLDVTGNIRASGIAQANDGVFYGGGKSVTCAVLNTWYNVSFYFGLYVFRDGTSGQTAACLFDATGGAIFLANNITGFAGQNSGGTLQVRVTSGTTPRLIYWACLGAING